MLSKILASTLFLSSLLASTLSSAGQIPRNLADQNTADLASQNQANLQASLTETVTNSLDQHSENSFAPPSSSRALSSLSETSSSLPTDQERALGPWLDLIGGGQAIGPAQTVQLKNQDGSLGSTMYGSLENGTLLPAQGEGFRRLNSPNTSWGTGMMVTLLERASLEMNRVLYPGTTILIASIAQEHGGPYRPHKSHQNGLDADVVFAGMTRYESVLDPQGHVTEKFEPQKNWDFWRLFVQQQILQKGQATSAVSMILVSPEIKQYLCSWAKERGILNNPLDAEVMRRLRPTVGHDDHFHLRLKCSPHHPKCYQQGDIASGTGCP